MKLTQEYCKRHKVSITNVLEDGVCFFDDAKGNPKRICLTSSNNRSASNCSLCSSDKIDLIVEIYDIVSDNSLFNGIFLLRHSHVGCNHEISQEPELKSLTKFVPVDITDIERWIWNAYVMSSKSKDKLKMIKKNKKDASCIAFKEYLFELIDSKNDIFVCDYLKQYNKFLIGRKYLH